MTKKNEEIMEILEAYDLTRCASSAAELSGSDRMTVQRYVGLRDAGRDPLEHARRGRLIDPFMEKVEELVEDSKGKVRADVVRRTGTGRPRISRWPTASRRPVPSEWSAKQFAIGDWTGRRMTFTPWLRTT